MSHFSRVKTQIMDKSLLISALAEMGYDVETGDLKIGGFGGQQTPVEIKAKRRLSNDIGLRKNGETYEIVADWWGVRGMNKQEFTEKLAQKYAYQAARKKFEEQGFALVSEETSENGQIRLVLRRME